MRYRVIDGSSKHLLHSCQNSFVYISLFYIYFELSILADAQRAATRESFSILISSLHFEIINYGMPHSLLPYCVHAATPKDISDSSISCWDYFIGERLAGQIFHIAVSRHVILSFVSSAVQLLYSYVYWRCCCGCNMHSIIVFNN